MQRQNLERTLKLCLNSWDHKFEFSVLECNQHILWLYRLLARSGSIVHGAIGSVMLVHWIILPHLVEKSETTDITIIIVYKTIAQKKKRKQTYLLAM